MARGFNLINESAIARLTITQFHTAIFFVFLIMIIWSAATCRRFLTNHLNFTIGARTFNHFQSGDKSPHSKSESLPRVHQEVFDNWSQAQHREECQSSDD